MNDLSSPSANAETCNPLAPDTFTETLANLASAQALDLDPFPLVKHDVQHWHTKEGTRVRFLASHERPMFDLVLRFKAGSALDGDTPGLAALALYALDQGTAQLNATQFTEQLEGLGAIMSRQVTQDCAIVTLRSLNTPDLRTCALRLITEMVARPAFRPDDVAKISARLVGAQQGSLQPLHVRLFDATMGQLLAGHPYATPLAGTLDGLGSLAPDDVRAFHRQAYSANNLDIGLVGDLSREEAEALVNDLVQALPQQWAAVPPPTLPAPTAGPLHLGRPGASTQVLLTLPLHVWPQDEDYPALLMANEILGAGFESRLTAELRTRRALTYSIYAVLEPMDAGCLWQVSWDIAPEHRDASRVLVSNVLECFIAHGPTQAECDLALNQLAGKLMRGMADNAVLAKGLAAFSHQGLPANHLASYREKLAALTPEDIRQAARGWLDIKKAFFATLGPAVDQQPLPEPPTIGV